MSDYGETTKDGMTARLVYLHDAQLIVPYGKIGRWLADRLLRRLDFSVHIYTEGTGWNTLLVNVGLGRLRFIDKDDRGTHD